MRLALRLAVLVALAAPARAEIIVPELPSDPASAKISVVVTPGLTKMSRLPGAELRKARKAMQEGVEIPDSQLRELADRGDGLAAQKYVRRLVPQGLAAHASDIAYYGSIAVATGRVWTLPEAVAAMRLLDPATEPSNRKKKYIAMLYPHAWAGNSLALDAVIDLNGEGRLFGPMSAATRAKIEAQGQKAGDGRVALRQAVALLQIPAPTAADLDAAHGYLNMAAKSGLLSVRAIAVNLLAQMDADADAGVATVALGQ